MYKQVARAVSDGMTPGPWPHCLGRTQLGSRDAFSIRLQRYVDNVAAVFCRPKKVIQTYPPLGNQ